jgi:Cation transport ATPase
LFISLSQFYPPLQVGFLFTYLAPLCLVLVITLSKEAYDDFLRWQRDKEVNNEVYKQFTILGPKDVASADIEVGQILEIHHHERIPADMILLQTHDDSGTVFIKTDQLDGETD